MVAAINNVARQRWEIIIGGHLSHLSYRDADGVFDFHDLHVTPAVAGRGIGGRLVRAALEDARVRRYQVVPSCPIVAGFIQRHPHYLTLVPVAYQRTVMAPDE